VLQLLARGPRENVGGIRSLNVLPDDNAA